MQEDDLVNLDTFGGNSDALLYYNRFKKALSPEYQESFQIKLFPSLKDIILKDENNTGGAWGIFGPPRKGKSFFSIALFKILFLEHKFSLIEKFRNEKFDDVKFFNIRYISSIEPKQIDASIPRCAIIPKFDGAKEGRFVKMMHRETFDYSGVYAIDDLITDKRKNVTDFMCQIFRSCTGHTNFHAVYIHQDMLSLEPSARSLLNYVVLFSHHLVQQQNNIYSAFFAKTMNKEAYSMLIKMQKAYPFSSFIIRTSANGTDLYFHAFDRDPEVLKIKNDPSIFLASDASKFLGQLFSKNKQYEISQVIAEAKNKYVLANAKQASQKKDEES